MADLSSLPVEIHEKILSLVSDPFTLHRVERVCRLWRDIIARFEKNGLRFRTRKALVRLSGVASLGESLDLEATKTTFREGSALAEMAERVFLTHMEIVRLKYPGTLQRLHGDATHAPEFGLLLRVSRPILLMGVAVFLPHGEHILDDVRISVSVHEHAVAHAGPFGRPLLLAESVTLGRKQQLEHSAMCIDHQLGTKTRGDVVCFEPPQCIRSQRKFKRRCFGVHPWPILYPESLEILSDRVYYIGVAIGFAHRAEAVECVWGEGGDNELRAERGVRFFFEKLHRHNQARSSVSSGQIPMLYYV